MTTTSYLDDLITQRGITCRSCGASDNLDLELMDAGPHHGRITCTACDTFVTWAPKPTTRPTSRDGRKAGLLNVIRAEWNGEPLYCLMCLRDERLFPQGVWLEAHHIVEYADGGTDHPGNLHPLCNECHALTHWRRRTATGAQIGKEEAEHAPS